MNGEQRTRLLAWLGPDPVRYDVAHLAFAGDHLAAHGSSTCSDYTLSYRLETGPRWVTRLLDVSVDGDGWRRTLRLARSADGAWTARRTETADGARPTDESIVLPEFSGALDCDLGLCPLTNTMPVLRERLIDASRRGEHRRVELQMAWVSVPELDVVASTQRYESGVPTAGGGAQIRYASGTFVEYIEFDDEGVVVSYPSIGRRLAG